jgi:hypothetical protein
MSRIGRTLKGYLFWTYDRGSFHYDVMVSLILAFIFIAPHFAPHFFDFKNHPAEQAPHPNGVVVSGEAKLYQVDAAAVDAQDEGMVRANFLRVIRPLAGDGSVDRVEPVRDASGHIVAYRAWVRK